MSDGTRILTAEQAEVAELPLTLGKVALVDASDLPILLWKKWQARCNRHTWYAVTTINGNTQALHRLLMQPAAHMQVDHINGNGLDNRRSNLRVCTPSENQLNQHAPVRSSSGYRGVSWHRRNKRWTARIEVLGRLVHLGAFQTAEDAAAAYDRARQRFSGLDKDGDAK